MNHHVNNGQYIRIAMDALQEEGRIRQLRAEYRKQVYLGDVLIPYVASSGDGRQTVVLRGEDDAVCCIVELEKDSCGLAV